MSKRKNPNERVRKIGEREEIVEYALTSEQLANSKDEIMALLDQKQETEEKKAEVMSNYKSQLATIDLQIESTRRTIRSGRRKETLTIEEHLTASNEIVRVRKDTGQQIGRRTASAEELQERLFPEAEVAQGDDGPPADPALDGIPAADGFGDSDDAFAEAPA